MPELAVRGAGPIRPGQQGGEFLVRRGIGGSREAADGVGVTESLEVAIDGAPDIAAQTSCRKTDLPEPDLPKTATLWLPAAFWNGDQKNGCPRLPMSRTCGM